MGYSKAAASSNILPQPGWGLPKYVSRTPCIDSGQLQLSVSSRATHGCLESLGEELYKSWMFRVSLVA